MALTQRQMFPEPVEPVPEPGDGCPAVEAEELPPGKLVPPELTRFNLHVQGPWPWVPGFVARLSDADWKRWRVESARRLRDLRRELRKATPRAPSGKRPRTHNPTGWELLVLCDRGAAIELFGPPPDSL